MKFKMIMLGVVIGLSVNNAHALDLSDMHEALKLLMEARHHLEKAPSEHGGHKFKAMQLTIEAIKETEDSINWTRQYGNKSR